MMITLIVLFHYTQKGIKKANINLSESSLKSTFEVLVDVLRIVLSKQQHRGASPYPYLTLHFFLFNFFPRQLTHHRSAIQTGQGNISIWINIYFSFDILFHYSRRFILCEYIDYDVRILRLRMINYRMSVVIV